MNNEQAKSSWQKFFSSWSTRFVLTYTALLAATSIMHILLFKSIPPLNGPIIYFGLGLFFGWVGTSYGYYFTSNKDQSDKSKIEHAKDLHDISKPQP